MSKIKAKTHWVWTQQGANAYNKVAGEPVYEPYTHNAPVDMINSGYIIDSTEYTGQTDLFSALEG